MDNWPVQGYGRPQRGDKRRGPHRAESGLRFQVTADQSEAGRWDGQSVSAWPLGTLWGRL